MKSLLLALLIFGSTAWALPQVSITTNGDITGGKTKNSTVPAQLTIVTDGPDTSMNMQANAKIRLRGNSSRAMEKRSFRLTLQTSQSVLGMPADRDWVLVANYSDKTLLRNFAALELSRRVGVAYTPRVRFVEVVFNGQPLGNYLMSEQVKVAPARVNIDPSNGFLLELDQRRDNKNVLVTNRNVPYSIKEPAVIYPDKVEEIADYMQDAEDALNSDDFTDPTKGYAKYIDVESFINIYLVEEIFKNQDAAYFSSIFLYKPVGGKLVLGPAWDFDIGAGNVDYSDAKSPAGWWIQQHSPWFKRLFEDPSFRRRVKVRWNQLKATKIDTLNDFIDRSAAKIDNSQRKNFEIWPTLNKTIWPNPVVMGSYAGEVRYLKFWLNNRIAWMDAEIQRY